MSSLFVLFAQIVVGLNYLLTCFLVLTNYSLGWALISFFIVPIGAVAAPFFVQTWGFLLIGIALFAIGTFLKSQEEKKFARQFLQVQESRTSKIASVTQNAEVIGSARAMPIFETDEIRGNGKLFGLPGGNLYWLGDNGITYDMKRYLKSWGKSPWKSQNDSQDLYLMTDTRNEFVIPAGEKNSWITWLSQHHNDKKI